MLRSAPLLRALVSALVVCLAPAVVYGQGGETGSIVGYVLDQTGMPIKGVKVSASSDTQIGGTKTAYSNDEGSFRFPSLLPGTFEIKATAPKMRAVYQKGIPVGVNAAAEVTLIMEVETAVEEVKVVEKAPIVSTTTAVVKDVYDEEFIDNLPLETRTAVEEFVGRNTPGATHAGTRTARIRGGNTDQNAFQVDGFYMNGQKTTYKSLAAMEVQTAGYGADGATSPGGVVSMVTKSGSNKYEFEINGFAEDSTFKFFTDESDSEARTWRYYVNPSISGPIVRDRLWFYLNIETRSEISDGDPDPSGYFATPPRRSYGNGRGTFKLTWQLTPRHKIQSFTIMNRDFSKNNDRSFATERDAQSKMDHWDGFTGLTWEALLSDNLVMTSKAGVTRFWQETAPERCRLQPVDCDHIVPITQTIPQTIKLQNYGSHEQRIANSIELIEQLEWFKNTKNFGDHNVKMQSKYRSRTDEIATTTPGDMSITYRGHTPESATEYYANDPRLDSERFGWDIRTSTGYQWVTSLTDSVRITRYLTLNPGASLVMNAANNSENEELLNNWGVTQHLSAAYDATHDGRTVLRASFNSMLDPEMGRLARHTLGGRVSRKCNWSESAQEFNSSCVWSGGNRNTVGLPCGPSGVDEYGSDCRERIRLPRTWEYTLGAEREIVQGIAVGSDFIYRLFTYPYTTGETNRIWNQSGTELERTGGYRNGRNETINNLSTPPTALRTYKGITTSVRKREGKLKIHIAYTWSHLYGNVWDTEGAYGFGMIPAKDQMLYGDLPSDRRHSVNTTLNYQLWKWMTIGIAHSYNSGEPYDRKFRNVTTGERDDLRSRVGTNPGADINDPGDDRPSRLPDQMRLNVMLRANIKPLTGIQLEPFVDFMNILALRTTTSVVEDDGPRYGAPSGRMGPMWMRLGARYKY